MADEDAGIHSMATVPPPEGGGDAYDAPTRVGEISADLLQALAAAESKTSNAPPPVAEPPLTTAVPLVASVIPVAAAAPSVEVREPPLDAARQGTPKSSLAIRSGALVGGFILALAYLIALAYVILRWAAHR